MDLRAFWSELTLARPAALYLLAVPAAVLLWSLINAREWVKIWAPLMRAIALALIVLAIASPETVMRYEGASQPALVDVSASITPEMRTWTAHLLKNELKLRSGDPAMIFAASTVPGTIGAVISQLDSTGCDGCNPDHTNRDGAGATGRRPGSGRRTGHAGNRRMGERRRFDARGQRALRRAHPPRHLYSPRRNFDSQRRDDGAVAAARTRKGRALRPWRYDGQLQSAACDRHHLGLSRRFADRGAQSDTGPGRAADRFSGAQRSKRARFLSRNVQG